MTETPKLPKKRKAESGNWWEEDDIDEQSTQKWRALEHHGVIFPPDYTPHGIPMIYDGEAKALSAEQEEVATWWAAVIGSEWEHKEIFRKNFEQNFLKLFPHESGVKSLDKCDVKKIAEHLEAQREMKKARPSEEKKVERELKQKMDEEIGYGIVDGKREKISNVIVEPPGLFRGRGQHPKAGFIKTRLRPEDITINVGKSNMVPKCPIPGHAWKNVVHNHYVTWLAYYKDPELSFSNVKYVYLAASSKFKGLNDKLKYEKARKLKNLIDGIRSDYFDKIKKDNHVNKQLGTALYLIDKLALRVGNEKSEDEADTVGCCSLKVSNISFKDHYQITLDFLGKDSMRYFNTVPVDHHVYNNLKSFTEGKSAEEELFDLITTSTLNEYLKTFMESLSAKVFRTYNASITLQTLLAKFNDDSMQVEEKVQFYTDANREVAILCNHQKSTPKNFDVQMEKMQDKLKDKLESLNFLQTHLKGFKDKKYTVDPEKKLPNNEDSTRKAIVRAQTSIKNMEIKLKMKDDNKTVALGTSKINYMDPRITIAWCKSNEVPIEKIFPKALRSKFIWAMYTEPSWEF
jgi:DNA topoisomerase-1